MAKQPITRERVREALEILKDTRSVRATAKELGLSRRMVQHLITAGEAMGEDVQRVEAQASRWRTGEEIVAARKAEFSRVARAAPRSGQNIIHRPDDGPFCLVFFGDEHLDNPGTSLELFEYWWNALDRASHITGWSLGDVLDNWIRVLAHLYSTSETPAPDGWTLVEHYMEQRGEDLDASIGGNHDAWSGHSDVLAYLMRQYGVLHKNNSLKVAYRCPNGREITVHARHSWPGRSQWNEVHGLKKAARMGVRETILVGGHTHVSGESMEKCPLTGKITFCYQVASFKVHDDYADDMGFLDRATSPAIAVVIDPRLSDEDPDLVKHFHDPYKAAAYLKMLRA